MAYTGPQRDSAAVCSVPNTERLEQMLDEAGFALLVLTAESDRTDGVVPARQNVVHGACSRAGPTLGNVGELLHIALEPPHGPGARIRLDSGEVVVVSMAGSTIRVTALRRILVVVPWVETIWEGGIHEAYTRFAATKRQDDAPALDTPEQRIAAFFGSIVGAVQSVPNVAALDLMLPEFFGRDIRK